MSARPDRVLVVIDAQRAFVDPAGSLWRTHGASEVQPGVAALDRLHALLAAPGRQDPAIWVRSEYSPGQFTGGDLHDGMAYVCVPGANVDCEWAAGVAQWMSPGDVVVTKRQADAWQAPAFRDAIGEAILAGASRLVVVGFQLTTCVAASALSMVEGVRGRDVEVVVVEELTGTRASSHLPGASGVSRVESTRRQLAAAGVEIV